MWKPQAALGRDGVRVYEARRAGHILSGLLDDQACSAFPERWHCARPYPPPRDSRHRNVAALSRSPLFPHRQPWACVRVSADPVDSGSRDRNFYGLSARDFRAASMEWRVNTFISDPLEAPFAEEFAFRGAILTALDATSPGSQSFLRLRLGTLVSAVLFRRHIYSPYLAACR
jgi:hypothetical protein